MSTMKKGITVRNADYCKHQRPYGRRQFWGRQRADDKILCELELIEGEEALFDRMKEYEGLEPAAATVFFSNPKARKKKVRKKFKIKARYRWVTACHHHNQPFVMAHRGNFSKWFTWRAFADEKDRDKALDQIQRSSQGGVMNWEYRAA